MCYNDGVRKSEKGTNPTTIIGGFVRMHHKDTPRVEAVQPDELSRKDEAEAEQRLAEQKARKEPGKWPKKRSAAGKRRNTLSVMGIPKDALDAGHAQYAKAVRLARAYRKHRMREFAVSHGYVSAGASSLLATAALALAASRYLYELATSAPIENVPQLLKQASQLADSARQNELAAWELCAREAVARKKTEASSQGVPWLVPQQEKKSRGRPRKGTAGPQDILGTIPDLGSMTPWVSEGKKSAALRQAGDGATDVGTTETLEGPTMETNNGTSRNGTGVDEAVSALSGAGDEESGTGEEAV